MSVESVVEVLDKVLSGALNASALEAEIFPEKREIESADSVLGAHNPHEFLVVFGSIVAEQCVRLCAFVEKARRRREAATHPQRTVARSSPLPQQSPSQERPALTPRSAPSSGGLLVTSPSRNRQRRGKRKIRPTLVAKPSESGAGEKDLGPRTKGDESASSRNGRRHRPGGTGGNSIFDLVQVQLDKNSKSKQAASQRSEAVATSDSPVMPSKQIDQLSLRLSGGNSNSESKSFSQRGFDGNLQRSPSVESIREADSTPEQRDGYRCTSPQVESVMRDLGRLYGKAVEVGIFSDVFDPLQILLAFLRCRTPMEDGDASSLNENSARDILILSENGKCFASSALSYMRCLLSALDVRFVSAVVTEMSQDGVCDDDITDSLSVSTKMQKDWVLPNLWAECDPLNMLGVNPVTALLERDVVSCSSGPRTGTEASPVGANAMHTPAAITLSQNREKVRDAFMRFVSDFRSNLAFSAELVQRFYTSAPVAQRTSESHIQSFRVRVSEIMDLLYSSNLVWFADFFIGAMIRECVPHFIQMLTAQRDKYEMLEMRLMGTTLDSPGAGSRDATVGDTPTFCTRIDLIFLHFVCECRNVNFLREVILLAEAYVHKLCAEIRTFVQQTRKHPGTYSNSDRERSKYSVWQYALHLQTALKLLGIVSFRPLSLLSESRIQNQSIADRVVESLSDLTFSWSSEGQADNRRIWSLLMQSDIYKKLALESSARVLDVLSLAIEMASDGALLLFLPGLVDFYRFASADSMFMSTTTYKTLHIWLERLRQDVVSGMRYYVGKELHSAQVLQLRCHVCALSTLQWIESRDFDAESCQATIAPSRWSSIEDTWSGTSGYVPIGIFSMLYTQWMMFADRKVPFLALGQHLSGPRSGSTVPREFPQASNPAEIYGAGSLTASSKRRIRKITPTSAIGAQNTGAYTAGNEEEPMAPVSGSPAPFQSALIEAFLRSHPGVERSLRFVVDSMVRNEAFPMLANATDHVIQEVNQYTTKVCTEGGYSAYTEESLLSVVQTVTQAVKERSIAQVCRAVLKGTEQQVRNLAIQLAPIRDLRQNRSSAYVGDIALTMYRRYVNAAVSDRIASLIPVAVSRRMKEWSMERQRSSIALPKTSDGALPSAESLRLDSESIGSDTLSIGSDSVSVTSDSAQSPRRGVLSPAAVSEGSSLHVISVSASELRGIRLLFGPAAMFTLYPEKVPHSVVCICVADKSELECGDASSEGEDCVDDRECPIATVVAVDMQCNDVTQWSQACCNWIDIVTTQFTARDYIIGIYGSDYVKTVNEVLSTLVDMGERACLLAGRAAYDDPPVDLWTNRDFRQFITQFVRACAAMAKFDPFFCRRLCYTLLSPSGAAKLLIARSVPQLVIRLVKSGVLAPRDFECSVLALLSPWMQDSTTVETKVLLTIHGALLRVSRKNMEKDDSDNTWTEFHSMLAGIDIEGTCDSETSDHGL